jgi:hypothetical protein
MHSSRHVQLTTRLILEASCGATMSMYVPDTCCLQEQEEPEPEGRAEVIGSSTPRAGSSQLTLPTITKPRQDASPVDSNRFSSTYLWRNSGHGLLRLCLPTSYRESASLHTHT